MTKPNKNSKKSYERLSKQIQYKDNINFNTKKLIIVKNKKGTLICKCLLPEYILNFKCIVVFILIRPQSQIGCNDFRRCNGKLITTKLLFGRIYPPCG